MKRAVHISEYDQRTLLCDDEKCVRNPTYMVDGTPLCTIHAKAEALVILLNEEKV